MESKKNRSKISVIIPVYNEEKLIYHCLNSIYKTDYTNFEVIVVDDGSKDNSVKIAQKFSCKIIKLKQNRGVSYARNIGAKNATGKILYFVDSDIIQKNDNLTKIAKEFEKDPKLKVLGASFSKIPFNKGFAPEFIMLKYYYQTTVLMKKRGLKRQKVTFLSTCSLAIKKQIFDESGGFDTSFKLGGEEHELGHRISKNHSIYICKDLTIAANLPTLRKRAINLLKRSIIHASVFSKWKKFESFGCLTLKEAFITLLVILISISFLISLIYSKIIIIPLILFTFFLLLNSKFYYFLFKQKNLIFMIKSIPSDFILTFSQGIGTSIGFLKIIPIQLAHITKKIYESTRFLFNTLPSHLVLFVTSKCNGNCSHCFLDTHSKDEELNLNEIKKLSKNLSHVHYLSITGGEPSLRKDTAEICKTFYENNSLQSITYHTNGILSSTIQNQVKQIMDYCPNVNLTVSISIDDLGKNHDIIRGKKGCFKHTLRTIDLLNKELEHKNKTNLKITVNTIYSKFNKENVNRLHSFVKNRLNLAHTMSFIRGNTKDISSKNVEVKEYERIMKIWQRDDKIKTLNPYFLILRSITHLRPKIIKQTLEQQKQVLPCKAGRKSIVIMSTGEIYPCEMLNKSFGNVRNHDYDIKRMLFSKSSKKIKSFIKSKKCFCTWECIIPLNIIFNLKSYPKIIKEFFNNFRS